MADTIEYTGTFKTLRDIADWINNHPGGGGDDHFDEGTYVNINGQTVTVLYQKEANE